MRKVRISHVPVYACQDCSAYELVPSIKPDLVCYIHSLGEVDSRMNVSFADTYEPAAVLREVLSLSLDSVQEIQKQCNIAFDDRINMLLDLYRVAKIKGDSVWIAEIQTRLRKLTAFMKIQKEYLEYCMN
ncbi:hypothetical protein [Paenibacillus dakarensis]|uniref:hypothetical protein n=1 Tax=Paenibacillus dakarensis TaxID=1527293 RepID=UPI001FE09B94|nr:hypothetical protein [Paenibacillus dakarensis]